MSDEGHLGKVYKDGEIIVEEGTPSRSLFIIQSGKVKIFKGRGEKETALAMLGESDIFGEMSLFDASPRSATAKSVGETRVLAIDHEGLLKRIKMDPTLAFRIIRQMSRRIRSLNTRLISVQSAINQIDSKLLPFNGAMSAQNADTKLVRDTIDLIRTEINKLTELFIQV